MMLTESKYRIHSILLVLGSLSNGTAVTHMVNKMKVVNYLSKVYGSKNSNEHRNSKAVKGSNQIFIYFIFLHVHCILCFLFDMLSIFYSN